MIFRLSDCPVRQSPDRGYGTLLYSLMYPSIWSVTLSSATGTRVLLCLLLQVPKYFSPIRGWAGTFIDGGGSVSPFSSPVRSSHQSMFKDLLFDYRLSIICICASSGVLLSRITRVVARSGGVYCRGLCWKAATRPCH